MDEKTKERGPLTLTEILTAPIFILMGGFVLSIAFIGEEINLTSYFLMVVGGGNILLFSYIWMKQLKIKTPVLDKTLIKIGKGFEITGKGMGWLLISLVYGSLAYVFINAVVAIPTQILLIVVIILLLNRN